MKKIMDKLINAFHIFILVYRHPAMLLIEKFESKLDSGIFDIKEEPKPKPITFGDVEQIQMIKDFIAEYEMKQELGEISEYNVSLTVDGSYDVIVEAYDDKEAEILAKESFSPSDLFIEDIRIWSVDKIENKSNNLKEGENEWKLELG